LEIEPTRRLVKDLDGIVASCCTNVKDWEKIWYISKDKDEVSEVVGDANSEDEEVAELDEAGVRYEVRGKGVEDEEAKEEKKKE
jgi:hypothetical protein